MTKPKGKEPATAKPKNSGQFGKGNPGKPKGAVNHLTKSVKEALEIAFEGVGGVEKLTEWATANPNEFFKLWIKLLPTKIEGGLKLEHLFSPEQLRRMADLQEGK